MLATDCRSASPKRRFLDGRMSSSELERGESDPAGMNPAARLAEVGSAIVPQRTALPVTSRRVGKQKVGLVAAMRPLTPDPLPPGERGDEGKGRSPARDIGIYTSRPKGKASREPFQRSTLKAFHTPAQGCPAPPRWAVVRATLGSEPDNHDEPCPGSTRPGTSVSPACATPTGLVVPRWD